MHMNNFFIVKIPDLQTPVILPFIKNLLFLLKPILIYNVYTGELKYLTTSLKELSEKGSKRILSHLKILLLMILIGKLFILY